MPVVADAPPGAVRGAVVDRDRCAAVGDDPQHVRADPVADLNLRTAQPGRDGVGVAAESDQCLSCDDLAEIELGRERDQRRGVQPLGCGHPGDDGPFAVMDPATAVELDRESIEPGLGLGDRDVVAEGAPPALRGRVVGLLDHALAVPAPRRTRHRPDP
ncbi:hypothetical protein BB31_39440 [Amycolatopsis lurida NRRL 2430]|uniref:Uncharacterized protein n=1 Tax=Amycolatopsis lurida NRRL 2430 TaxID=1460371 RepID=A0A2P2FGD2_AMYLU|nr:hypothetical protein BB31_39440 [Amycolatopsis lurida NRRL 2430]